jgi:hypothetical protein
MPNSNDDHWNKLLSDFGFQPEEKPTSQSPEDRVEDEFQGQSEVPAIELPGSLDLTDEVMEVDILELPEDEKAPVLRDSRKPNRDSRRGERDLGFELDDDADDQNPGQDKSTDAAAVRGPATQSTQKKPVPSTAPAKPVAPATQKPASLSSHWDVLAGELGLKVPERPEPEFVPKPVTPQPTAEKVAPAKRSDDRKRADDTKRAESTKRTQSTQRSEDKGALDELFVPRENFDDERLDMFTPTPAPKHTSLESAFGAEPDQEHSEGADAVRDPFDRPEDENDDGVESIEVVIEDLDADDSTPARRRRRRSRRRRSETESPQSSVDAEDETVEKTVLGSNALDEIDEVEIEVADIAEIETSLDDVTSSSEESSGGKSDDGPRRKPRRRRRRGKKTSGDSASNEKTARDENTDSEEFSEEDFTTDDVEDRNDPDAADPDAADPDAAEGAKPRDPRRRKSRAMRICGWVEAVSTIVDANIERHKKDEPGGRRPRSRGRRR